jgi:hypothetical protein
MLQKWSLTVDLTKCWIAPISEQHDGERRRKEPYEKNETEHWGTNNTPVNSTAVSGVLRPGIGFVGSVAVIAGTFGFMVFQKPFQLDG